MLVRSAPVLLVSSLLLTGCADAERLEPPPLTSGGHTVEFVGYVFDGATGTRLTGYDLGLLTGGTEVTGSVAEDGRFRVGPISAWSDYSIAIQASDYRTFVSHNGRVGLPPELAQSDDIAEIASQQVLHYDAYVFPSGLEAPQVAFTITTPIGNPPSGKIRLRPTSASILSDDPFETPSGVPGQIWGNDEDLQASTFNDEFASGMVAIDSGELVYGVTYAVSVFDVAGHQPFSGTYQAGIETDKTFALAESLAEPLVVLTSDDETCTPPSLPTATSASVVNITFNAEIELEDIDVANEALDSNIGINSPNQDADMDTNTLADDASNMAIERGVSVTAMGNMLIISFNPSAGLVVKDPDDPILSVTYGGLSEIVVRRPGSPSSAVALSTVLGKTSITCIP